MQGAPSSGSGKELVARKIHKNSSRNKKSFIVLNGALLDSNKYELELFGEEKDNGSISYGAYLFQKHLFYGINPL